MTATLNEPECEILRHLAGGERSAQPPSDGIVVFDDGPEVRAEVLDYMQACSPPLISVTGVYRDGSSIAIRHDYELTEGGRIALGYCDEVETDRSVTLSDEELGIQLN